jgi:hypothetical protein
MPIYKFSTAGLKNVLLFLIPVVLLSNISLTQSVRPVVLIGNHTAMYNNKGMLLPWTSWQQGGRLTANPSSLSHFDLKFPNKQKYRSVKLYRPMPPTPLLSRHFR